MNIYWQPWVVVEWRPAPQKQFKNSFYVGSYDTREEAERARDAYDNAPNRKHEASYSVVHRNQ